MTSYQCQIPAELDRSRLDKAITALLKEQSDILSRARLQALIEAGHVTLKGKACDNSNHKVKTDEIYTVDIPAATPALPEAQEMPLSIIYEDDDLIVIDKPAGLVVHPAPGNRDHTLVNALLAHCGASLSGIGGVARPGIVHRLDKDTSGLLVVAKNDAAHQALTKQFADRSLSRTYQAIVWGAPAPASGDIAGSIGRHIGDRKKMAVTAKGKAALTHYTTLKTFGQPPIASLIECKLSTGRTHQIRVHLAAIKHPVLGDKTYGGRPARAGHKSFTALADFPRQALHAVALKLIHPRTGKAVSFTSPVPTDMKDLLKALKKK